MRTITTALVLLALATSPGLADPVPVEPGREPSPWTLPIALAVMIGIITLIIVWRRRR